MSIELRSLADVRSYYFREKCAELDHFDPAVLDCALLSDFRPLWREANALALEWRRQATNRYNPQTRQWEQR